jgi:hypothetical protein
LLELAVGKDEGAGIGIGRHAQSPGLDQRERFLDAAAHPFRPALILGLERAAVLFAAVPEHDSVEA